MDTFYPAGSALAVQVQNLRIDKLNKKCIEMNQQKTGDRFLEKSQHYPKTQCHRLHVDVPEEILLYPQAKLYPLSKFEFGTAVLKLENLPTEVSSSA